MIAGIGLDIVETERFAHALGSLEGLRKGGGGHFAERVFTPRELEACATRADRIQALAARFAAKEACLKALGSGLLGSALHDVEILSSRSGAPQLRLTGALAERARARGVRSAHVSLTHQPGLAAAVVILEGTRMRAASRPPRRRGGRGAARWTLETVSSGTW
ncbi:MAG TPA: holo-ACP synthase [Gemmatimonadales bacterium]|jgi:holo-[acyl-carrier protein] synthase|nr:holo-ACP synthase [Gemmatimonadales bacterium]